MAGRSTALPVALALVLGAVAYPAVAGSYWSRTPLWDAPLASPVWTMDADPTVEPRWRSDAGIPTVIVCGSLAGAGCLGLGDRFYPEAALLAGREGTVVLVLVIGRSGAIESMRSLQPVPGLGAAAAAAASYWLEQLGPQESTLEPREVNVSVEFTIRRAAGAARGSGGCRPRAPRITDTRRAYALARGILAGADFVARPDDRTGWPPHDLVDVVAQLLAQRFDLADVAAAERFFASSAGRAYLGASSRIELGFDEEELAAPPPARASKRRPDEPPPPEPADGLDRRVSLEAEETPAGHGVPDPRSITVQRDRALRRHLTAAERRELRDFTATPYGTHWLVEFPCLRAEIQAAVEDWYATPPLPE